MLGIEGMMQELQHLLPYSRRISVLCSSYIPCREGLLHIFSFLIIHHHAGHWPQDVYVFIVGPSSTKCHGISCADQPFPGRYQVRWASLLIQYGLYSCSQMCRQKRYIRQNLHCVNSKRFNNTAGDRPRYAAGRRPPTLYKKSRYTVRVMCLLGVVGIARWLKSVLETHPPPPFKREREKENFLFCPLTWRDCQRERKIKSYESNLFLLLCNAPASHCRLSLSLSHSQRGSAIFFKITLFRHPKQPCCTTARMLGQAKWYHVQHAL
jgi:hypothetical protein